MARKKKNNVTLIALLIIAGMLGLIYGMSQTTLSMNVVNFVTIIAIVVIIVTVLTWNEIRKG
jgi:uncharacterized membrane protein